MSEVGTVSEPAEVGGPATADDDPPTARPVRPSLGARLRRRTVRAVDALEQLVGGLGTAVLAVVTLLWLLVVAVTSVIGLGLVLLPGALAAVRAVADRERARLARLGHAVVGPPPVPAGRRAALADPSVRRELAWVAWHGTGGLLLGLVGIALPLAAVQDVTFPLWWRLIPEGEATSGSLGFWLITDTAGSLRVALVGVAWVTLTLVVAPHAARAQAAVGRRLLGPPPGTDLALRVAELTVTRAAALDAHVAELRRIERSLHDGTQNRVVAVTVLLGAARRALDRDPAAAAEVLEKAQVAAESALAELRAVARGILPPVLDDRSLADALTGLAATSAVPCRLDVELTVACPRSIEATAYFAVAEALTNVARHSGASSAGVTVRHDDGVLRVAVVDDGRGGAAEDGGSGLAGIRRRVEAHDGALSVTSPAGGPTRVEVTLPCGS